MPATKPEVVGPPQEKNREDKRREESKNEAKNTYHNTMNTPNFNGRKRELLNGAYRMVFSDTKKPESVENHHNKLNLRDKSTEPSNLFGDANINWRTSNSM